MKFFTCILIAIIIFSLGVKGQLITTVAGNGIAGHSGDGGYATAASINKPTGVVIDNFGNVFISSHDDGRIRVILPTGFIQTYAGGGTGGLGDGGPATAASIVNPFALAVDNLGNLYVADNGNQRIRKISTGGIITTFAGGGFGGDGVPATDAQLIDPVGLAFDKIGNLYISDGAGNCIHKVDTTGFISTIAGTCGYAGYGGDGGPATDASFYYPQGISVDTTGNIYIADWQNSILRMIDTTGIINTIAGAIGLPIYYGDGGAASNSCLQFPTDVKTDLYGNIYIADCNNQVIRKINPSGIISTIAGNTYSGFSGDGGAPTYAKMNTPWAISVFGKGNVLVADRNNNRVRRVIANKIRFLNGRTQTFPVCSTSAYVVISPALAVIDSNTGRTLAWSRMTSPTHGSIFTSCEAYSTGGVTIPPTLLFVPDSGYYGLDSFKVKISNGLTTDSTKVYITRVSPPNPGAISGSDSLCVGTTVTLGDTSSGGIWSLTNSSAGHISNTVTGYLAGLDTVIYSIANACGTFSATFPITINQLPIVLPISGTSHLCLGSSVSITDATPSGVWNITNAHASISTFGIVTGISGGNDTAIYTVTNMCGATTVKYPMIIETFPYAGSILGGTSVCSGSVIILFDAVTGGIWSLSNAQASITTSGVVHGINAGFDTASYAVTNTCGTATTYHYVTIIPYTGGIIAGPNSVCMGSTITISDTTGGGLGTWTARNTHATVSSGIVHGISPGIDTINYSYTNVCGTATTQTTIQIKSLPDPGIILGSDSLCTGDTAYYIGTAISDLWSRTNNHLFISDSGRVIALTSGQDTIIHSISVNGCTTSIAKSIKIRAYGDAGTITGDDNVCLGSAITMSNSVTGGVWSCANYTTSVCPIPFGCLVVALAVGENIIFYSKSNDCGVTTVSKLVRVDPYPDAGFLLGSSRVCAGSYVTLNTTSPGGNWYSSNSKANVFPFANLGLVNGIIPGLDTIIYTNSNSCGIDSTQMQILIEMSPDSGSVVGNSTICIGQTSTLIGTPTGGIWLSVNHSAEVVNGMTTGVFAGTDTIVYIIANDCGFAIDSFPVQIIASGFPCLLGSTTQPKNGTDVAVLPNPASNIISINSPLFREQQIAAEILNPLGVVLISKLFLPIDKDEIDLPLTGLPNGIYYLRIKCMDVQIVKLFMKISH